MNWFDRKFSFNHLEGTFPGILERLRPIDLAFFVAEHDDHHLARITKIHRQLREQ